MTQLRTLAASTLVALVLALSVGLLSPAPAQVNPTADSVNEEALLDALSGNETISGRVTIPNSQAGVLIKPHGRAWAEEQSHTVWNITVWSIVGMLVLLVAFYLIRGRIRIAGGFSGRKILRFNWLERFAHWLAAVPFVILAITGLNVLIGRDVLLPLIGPQAFGAFSHWSKLAHNFLAWPFMLGVLLIFLFWIKDNFPSGLDVKWLARGGGLFSNDAHVPARRFNAGQKLIFWAVVIGGTLLSLTGLQLIFPDTAADAAAWQLAQVLHGIIAGLMVAVMLAHAYIGSIGMEGAFEAMGDGDVDLNWARQHHSLWVDEKLGAETRRGKPGGKVAPAE
jgi:formate dehydrogenase subunit gamma